jgi:hypothetical protein
MPTRKVAKKKMRQSVDYQDQLAGFSAQLTYLTQWVHILKVRAGLQGTRLGPGSGARHSLDDDPPPWPPEEEAPVVPELAPPRRKRRRAPKNRKKKVR